MIACPDCRSEKTKELPAPAPHRAKLVCAACERWLKWLPYEDVSTPPPSYLFERVWPAPVPLVGTNAQVAFATSIRSQILAYARKHGQHQFMQIVYGIRDASWFIANKDRGPDKYRWPAASQMARHEGDVTS